MSDHPTPNPTRPPASPESGVSPSTPPADSDLSTQIDSLLAEIDLGRNRLEEQAAQLTSPVPSAADGPISTPEIERELNELLRDAGASIPGDGAPQAATTAPAGAGFAADPRDNSGGAAADQAATGAGDDATGTRDASPAREGLPAGESPTPREPREDLAAQIDELLQEAESACAESSPGAIAAPAPSAPPSPTVSAAASPTPHASPAAPPPEAAPAPTEAPQTPALASSPPAESAAASPRSAPAASSVSKAVHAPSPPAAPPGPPLSSRLATVLARALTPLNAPFASQPKVVRDSLGWVAANTVFLGACLWVYIEFFRPDPKAAHTLGTFDFAHDDVPDANGPDHASGSHEAGTGQGASHGGDPKAKSGAHGSDKKAAAKKPDAKKADPHAKPPAKAPPRGGH